MSEAGPRLPHIDFSPEKEWEGQDSSGEVRARLSAYGRHLVGSMDRRIIAPALLTGAAVGLFGTAEGYLLSQGPHQAEFALQYGLEQIAPSIIWLTHEAQLTARSMGLNPSDVLRNLGLDRPDVDIEATVKHLYYLRSILASSVGLVYAVRVAGLAKEAGDRFKQNILRGKENLFPGPNERVIRFAGSQSDVTEYSSTLNF